MLERLKNWLSRRRGRGAGPSHVSPTGSTAFTTAFVALAGKMAKADGVAVGAEWEAFERFLEVPEAERASVRHLYDLAKRDVAGADAHARNLRELLDGQERLKRDVVECLIYVACSDGILHPAEDAFLASVALDLGLSREEFQHLRSLFVRDSASPYEVLGVSPKASDLEIKAAYRAAVAEIHPDVLIAAGAAPALIKAANAKLAALNGAYDEIVAERRLGVAR